VSDLRHGLYGRQRELAYALKADRQHYENAPLTEKARRKLLVRIRGLEEALAEVRQQIRALGNEAD
jgi:hypothetical protein